MDPKSLQGLSMEGQKVLEATVEAAHETLGSMNEVLCNPALWVTTSAAQPALANSDGSSKVEGRQGGDGLTQQEAGWAALDEARVRLKNSTTTLRGVITSIFNSPQMREQEADVSSIGTDKSDPVEVEKLEQRVSELREEVRKKNDVLKILIDQLRELIIDISMWQSPSL